MKNQLQELLANGRTGAVINLLRQMLDQIDQEQVRQEIVLYAAQYEQLEKNSQLNLMTMQELEVGRSKLNYALIQFVEKYPDLPLTNVAGTKPRVEATKIHFHKVETPAEQKERKRFFQWKYIAALGVIIGIFGSLAEILNYIDLIPNTSNQNHQLTIRVHALGDKSQIITEGTITVDIGHRRDPKAIASDGEVDFEQIESRFIGQPIEILFHSKKYTAAFPDSIYLFGDQAIYFPVTYKEAYKTISGIVRNGEGTELLDQVLVLTGDQNQWRSTTDSLGRFSIILPDHAVKDHYSLLFQKEGFASSTEFYYPDSGKEFRLQAIKE
ncbi:MAG: hypothetical protein AAFP19_12455 [Bacteroidota bacterium]